MFGFDNRYAGGLIEVFTDPRGIYSGNLKHYARIIFSAPNIHHGYHGLRHMLHVTWVCYKACEYYARIRGLTPHQMRLLLIAAIFHDYGHMGRKGDDVINLDVAVTAMRQSLLPEDLPYTNDIEQIMRATQYPHVDLGSAETLEQSIIRDADISQVFGVAWIGDILGGLGREYEMTPLEMLEVQLNFLNTVHFSSDFGRVFFGTEAIYAKINESKDLLAILKN